MTSVFPPRVIGHRGAAASAPENTLAGFRLARTLGVQWIELDVQLTADGVPVVFHDDRLDRTTDGTGALVETSLTALRRLDAGAWFGETFAGERVPTFDEALATITTLDLGLCLEIKANEERGEKTAEAALALLAKVWPQDRPTPVVSSFAKTALMVAAKMVPSWRRGLLVDSLAGDWLGETRRLGCSGLHCDQRVLEEATVAAMKVAGLAVLAYTVNERARAELLWGWGVDAVFSDRPELME